VFCDGQWCEEKCVTSNPSYRWYCCDVVEPTMDGDGDESEGFKVFVSRLPSEWTEQHLQQHFEACFGPILSVSIASHDTNPRGKQSSGFGFIVFESYESQQKALAQMVMHAKKKTIQIRPHRSQEEEGGEGEGGEESQICYMWRRHGCVRGDDCRFLHEGEGSCIQVSAPGEGKKKCLSFKSKGKCSKGDACPFLHIAKANASPVDSKASVSSSSSPGLCRSFVKKGKCRQGDRCRYLHVDQPGKRKGVDQSEDGERGEEAPPSSVKRKRIDGSTLVANRKRLLAEEKNAEGAGREGDTPSEGATATRSDK
jgi:RNA recognition motif-containing protein